MNGLPKDLVVLLGTILVEQDEFEALSSLAVTCRRFSICLSPLFPFIKCAPVAETQVLDYSSISYLTEIVRNYRGRLEFERRVFTFSDVVAAAVRACHEMMWFSYESAVGFDVLALLNSCGNQTYFFNAIPVRSLPARLRLRRAQAKAVKEGHPEEELRFCIVSVPNEATNGLLENWLCEMEKEERGVWSMSLALLFRIARQDGSVEKLLHRLDEICNNSKFSRFDGEFCCHSDGELFARPFLDYASVLACQKVNFEASEREGEFQIWNLPDTFFSESHFDKHVVPGLGLLFVALLGSKEKLTRVKSAKYSGDSCWIKSTVESDNVRRLETPTMDILIDRSTRTIAWKKRKIVSFSLE